MTPFASLIWKEWRGERRSIGTLAAAAALLPVLGLWLASRWAHSGGDEAFHYDESTATIVTHMALLAAALTVGAELVPREESGGAIALLRRLPCGLLRAFAAKFSLLVLVAASVALVAWFSACLAIGATGGPWFPRFLVNRSFVVASGLSSLASAVLLGGFALTASTWSRSATLALPIAIAALFLAALPFAAAPDWFPGLLLRADELRWLAWSAAGGAPLVAACSFVLGRRHGGGTCQCLVVGLATSLLLLLPAYGWLVTRIVDWGRIDPYVSSFRFKLRSSHGFLDGTGRFAFAPVQHEVIGLDDSLAEARDPAHAGNGPVHWLKVDLNDGSWREAERAELLSRDARNSEWDSIRRRDGTLVFLDQRQLVVEAPDGSRRALPDAALDQRGHASVWGGAFRFHTGPQHELYDVHRERRYQEVDPDECVRVRPGRWLVWTPTASASDSWRVPGEWQLFDPDRGETAPAPAAVAADRLLWFADDGSALGGQRGEQGRIDELFRIDPELGTRERIALPSWLEGSIEAIHLAERTHAGTPILRFERVPSHGDPSHHFARWDGARRELFFAGDADTPQLAVVGCPDEESLLVIEEQRRLVRLHFGSDAREVVFPNPNPRSEDS